jgi:putative restriction endonuclease
MNRVIQFFNYEQCFKHYTKQVISIRQAKIHGEIIVAKPVMLLAIIDGVEANVFMNNKFVLNDWLEERYKKLMEQFTKSSQFDGTTGIEKPFWHLESDGFWHLNYQGEKISKGYTPSKAWLKDNVEFAYFDEPLWILLQNKVWRMKLRDYIIEHKLTDDLWTGKIASEGLGVLVAILLAA